ncbi:NAD-dependent epimerase/dehydratase family protein [Aquimonas voraii]|uniref:2'-hydroxyisoflavone reductase n=1 Tax=Aquimonas voraii TaxID=265719 RepID=A0A1G7A081_9GAMM|nr:NAD-dependent epimerase/dehydratase family protein [Aquimonas voraii]SDE07907.1 2'-hydroxyisoflavone reductase [Aquimonas voraii]
MPIRRRDVLKLGALAGAAGLAPSLASAAAPAIGRAAKPLNILILGGTGFTGPHQVRYALARGHRITLFNRGRRPQDWPAEVEELVGDRETGELDALKGRRWDVCIDNPTSVPHWVRDVGEVLKGQVDHYLFISTLSVYSDSATPGQDEDAPREVYTGPDIMAETRASLLANMALYGPMKAACEDEALKWFPDITTLIRPGLIVGPGDETDRFSYWPLRVRRGGDILAPGDGRDPVQFIDARDLAEWTIRMAEQRVFGAFNAMGPAYPMGMDQLLYGIQAVTGTPATFHWAPAEFLAEQQVSPWGDMPVWVPGQGESAGFSRHRNDRALAQGLSFRPLAETVAATLAWFDAQPEERRATVRAGIKPEREAEVLAAWKARG